MTFKNGISCSFPSPKPAHGSGHDPGCAQSSHCGRTQGCSSTSRNSSLVYPPRTQSASPDFSACFMSVPGEAPQSGRFPEGQEKNTIAAKSLQTPMHTLIRYYIREPGKGKERAQEFLWVFRDLYWVPLLKQLQLQQVW